MSYSVFSQYRESKADDFAIAESSVEELKGGIRILTAFKQANIESRTTTFKKIAISSTGEMRIDILHPSLESRIKKIEKCLQERNETFNTALEKVKTVPLKHLVLNLTKQIEEIFNQAGFFGTMAMVS